MSGQMETIFQEIERALSERLYYLAIVTALSLPDVCAALASPDGLTSGSKYKAWYRNNLAPKYSRLTETDVYSLRCGVVHQGRFGHSGMQYDRVILTFPGAPLVGHHSLAQWPDATYLMLEVVTFCNDFVEAARRWFAANERDPIVQRNIESLVRFRPNGLPPRFDGMPMIA